MRTEDKILITGSKGLVGTNLVIALKEKGFHNLLCPTSKELDLKERKEVFDFFDKEKPKYVFHIAALVGGIKANIESPVEFLRDNLLMNVNVIDACFQFKIKKLVNLGSSCIYPKFVKQPMTEESLLTGKFEPTNEGYALSKITSIKLCEYYNKEYSSNFISLIPPNMYGINEKFDLDHSHVLAALIKKFHDAKIRKDLSVPIWGTGNVLREFLYVGDCVLGLILAMEKINPEDLFEKCFLNMGSGEEISIKNLAILIKEVVGFEGEILFDPSKPEGMERKILDSSKIKKLGFEEKTKLREGIKKTYDYYLTLN
jgi:GDP-L-fucose synthase